jgi:hypothetical protein
MFGCRFKPFGTACTDCEAKLPAGTVVPAVPAEPNPPVLRRVHVSECPDCFAVPGADHMIDLVHPDTDRSLINSKTLEEIAVQNPGAVRMKVADYLAQKAARQNSPVTWNEVTEERYWEMLEVLPPACMGIGVFCVGEPHDHCAATGQPRFQAYRKMDGKHFASSRPVTVKELSALIGQPLRNDYIS